MTPGSSSEAHQHRGDEEFFVIDGSLRDNDGTVYVKGDLVLLRDGTQHFSVSDDGCLLAVYIPKVEVNL
jgi:anti-sigma factor ChrR (cupin superfamily)